MKRMIKAGHAGLVLVAGITLIFLVLQPSRLLRPGARRIVRGGTMTIWAKWMIFALRINREVEGELPTGSAMLVANHVSWIDILVLMATYRGVFLAKSELGEWPLIGWMCRQTDTLFLKRESRRSMAEKVKTISGTLRAKENVLLFPEGTTTEGLDVRPFFPGLFQAAIDAGTIVQPVALRYFEKGQPSRCAPFVGDDDFGEHLGGLLAAGPIATRITFLPPIDGRRQERRELARMTHALIRGQIVPAANC